MQGIRGSSWQRKVGLEEIKASTENNTKKSSAAKSIAKGISSLKHGLRNAVSCFNPGKLSSKMKDFHPGAVNQSREFAASALKDAEKKLQDRMKGASESQGPGSSQHRYMNTIKEDVARMGIGRLQDIAKTPLHPNLSEPDRFLINEAKTRLNTIKRLQDIANTPLHPNLSDPDLDLIDEAKATLNKIGK